ncbi:MAG: hypothetical protein AUJ51_02450 [Elusimicrobia bacterium CG1_02_56_21]|nr:MAG: hypothetical protein AUJ51_02450 [Elusimicrobia bacterium CG1_02_56_21]
MFLRTGNYGYARQTIEFLTRALALVPEVSFLPVTLTPDFNLDVRAFASAKGLEYPVYDGAGHLPGQFRPAQSPMLCLIDHKGYVRDFYSPAGNDREAISSDLRGLLRDVLPGAGQ